MFAFARADPRRRRAVATPLRTIILAVAFVPASCACASEPGNPSFSIDGFATLGWSHSSEHEADFVGSSLQADGTGHTRETTAKIDSRIGLQFTAEFSPRWLGVLQIISEQRYDGSFQPTIEWANLRYQVTPDLDLRIGRTVLSSFLVSEYRKVGYIHPWVRPPLELYGLVPLTNNNGLDVSYRSTFHGFGSTLEAQVGASDFRIPGVDRVEVRKAWRISDTLERGDATLRLSYQRGEITLASFNALFDAFRSFGAQGAAIADRFDARGTDLRFISSAISYDPGDWFAMSEWGALKTDSAIGDRTGWYASTGVRRASLTPYLTYAAVEADSATSHPGLTTSAYPAAFAESIGFLNAGLNRALKANPSQQTFSLGTRWDVRSNVALKLQYDHTWLGDGSYGRLQNVQPAFVPGGEFDILTATVDIVF